jgi:hypothetical protein
MGGLTSEWNTTSVPFQLRRTWDCIREAPWARSRWTPPPRSLEDSPHNLTTTGEWNTSSVPIQSCGTSIREAKKLARPGSRVPSGQHQHQVTLGAESVDTPRSLEDSPRNLVTTGEWNTTSVPFQSCRSWDSIREAVNPAWPGSQVHSGWRQHQGTLGAESADVPKVP